MLCIASPVFKARVVPALVPLHWQPEWCVPCFQSPCCAGIGAVLCHCSGVCKHMEHMEDGWVAFKYMAGGELKSCPVLDNIRSAHAVFGVPLLSAKFPLVFIAALYLCLPFLCPAGTTAVTKPAFACLCHAQTTSSIGNCTA